MNFSPFTSVTRWLLVVIGCVVLATAQPMSAADPESKTPAPAEDSAGKIIYPKGSAEQPSDLKPLTRPEGSGRGFTLVIALLLAGAGAWVMIQKRQGSSLVSKGPRKLQIEETRPLGNRQYLVVANYEGRKMLLGVTAGQIQLISHLESEKVEDIS